MAETHWETFRRSFLPGFEETAPGITDAFNKFVAGDRLPDFYDFQDDPLTMYLANATGCRLAEELKDPKLLKMTYSNYRTALEECYSVAYFERFGCKVIRPSLGLVEKLIETEVNWMLKDIRSPAPHLYIALPKGHGIKAPSYKQGGTHAEIDGFYVSWDRVTEATRRAEAENKGMKVVHGLTMYAKSETGEQMLKDAPEESPVVNADAFGDWACRIMGVIRDGYRGHDWSIQFFNLHWADDSPEIAEGEFKRFQDLWVKSENSINTQYAIMEVYEKIFHLAANIFLYMSHPGKDDTSWKPSVLRERLRTRKAQLSSKQRRSLKLRILQEQSTEEWIVGQKVVVDPDIKPVDNASGMSDGLRPSPRAHWVRGFWRGQWIGSEKDNSRKKVPKWIEPYGRGIGVKPKTVEYKL